MTGFSFEGSEPGIFVHFSAGMKRVNMLESGLRSPYLIVLRKKIIDSPRVPEYLAYAYEVVNSPEAGVAKSVLSVARHKT